METYVHNIDPFAIHFWGEVGIRWYGLAYLAGFVLGLTYILKMAPRGNGILRNKEQLTDFTTWMAIGTLAGGRVGYAIFYSPDLLWDFSPSFPFWGVFAVHKGGMASHGGITGVMIATVLYARVHKVPILHLIDMTCVGGALGIFLGRIANFINGELYGRAVESKVSWAVKFPQEMYLWSSKQVSRLYELTDAAVALGEVEISKPSFGISTEISLRLKEVFSDFVYPKGEMVVITAGQWREWVTNYSSDAVASLAVNRTIESLIQATQTGNEKVIKAIAPALTARHPSQLYQGLMEGLLVFVICVIIWRKPRRPGVIAGWFGFCYLVARIVGEQFRLPDSHIGYQALGLTRGQWISIAYFGVVALIFYLSKKQNHKPLGGWSK